MKKFFFAIFFFIQIPAFSATSPDFIIAKINSKAITNSEVVDRYRFVITASKIKINASQDKQLLLNQVIDKMVDEELIRQEGANLKLEVTPIEVRDFIEIVALQQKKNATQFKLFFINNGLSFDNYLKQVESEVLWSKIMSEVLKSRVRVTDVEVKEFFEQHKFNTDVTKFFVAEILISNAGRLAETAGQLANKLVAELRQGADFKNIVRQFSGSITSENNGEIGWVSQVDIDQKIYVAISKLGKGGYSEPVLLADGYHIFKLLDAKTEATIADHDMNSARNAIFGKKLQSLAKGYLMDLRKKAFVEITS
jgi:peptidyl-prolyl cis-trans isomerase SurA